MHQPSTSRWRAAAPGCKHQDGAAALGCERPAAPALARTPGGQLPRRLTFLLTTAILWAAGCNGPGPTEQERLIADLRNTIAEKDTRLTEYKTTTDELHRQLDAARGVPADWRDHVVYPERLQIATLSGGADYDGQPGDDGVTVYLQPVDRDGDILKVAGDVRIELYDLANPPGHNLIGRYELAADEVRKLWYGQFMTSHFTIKCPWQTRPQHPEITIRATFVDYLMKRVMTAQATCTVQLSP